jgi:putative transposase
VVAAALDTTVTTSRWSADDESVLKSARSCAKRPRPIHWGAPRIHGELRKLGIDVSERTVSRLIPRHNRPPSQTWRTFLTSHVPAVASIDFFTVPTLTGRVLFVLVILSHARQRVVHVNVNEHPTAPWTAQQVVNAFPDETAPQWLVSDRDSIYSERFRRRVASLAIAARAGDPI